MASPISGCRNSSFSALHTLNDTVKASKPAVPIGHHQLGGLKRSISFPSLRPRSIISGLSAHEAGQVTAATPDLCCSGKALHLGRSQGTGLYQQAWEGGSRDQEEVVAATATSKKVDSFQRVVSPLATESRFASLSRVLLVGQPGSMFRTLANRKWPSAIGPISLLVFLFGTILALFAAVRGALVRKVKACKCCKGFGVVRCRLCDGRGSVDWRAKFSYSEMCPLCAAKRFVVCPECGGHYHRRLFNHAKGSKGTLESFFPGTGGGAVATRSNPLD